MTRSKLQDFEIVARLGHGSFGTVFRVRRLADDSTYVIKNVRIVELNSREQTDAINEVEILARLNSPYVVRYYDSFIDQESLHIVMEFCNRGDLQNLLRKAKEKNVVGIKEGVIWNICLQVFLGLHYLHRKLVLHRDLKCANVFLTKSATRQDYLVKIGDLGVARLMDTSSALASTIVGTPYYLSPELCHNDRYRDKSDCWALGVLMYECCTLERPFEARNQCALIMKIIEAEVEIPRELVSDLLSAIILWLLEKKPEDRPSMKTLLNEVRVRKLLMDYKFDLPADVAAMTPTDILGERMKKMQTPQQSQEFVLDSNHPKDEAPLTPRQIAALSRAQTSRDVSNLGGPASTAVATAVANAVAPNAGGVRGDRVRGNNQRVPSNKALTRYQVGSNSASRTGSISGRPEDKLSPADAELVAKAAALSVDDHSADSKDDTVMGVAQRRASFLSKVEDAGLSEVVLLYQQSIASGNTPRGSFHDGAGEEYDSDFEEDSPIEGSADRPLSSSRASVSAAEAKVPSLSLDTAVLDTGNHPYGIRDELFVTADIANQDPEQAESLYTAAPQHASLPNSSRSSHGVSTAGASASPRLGVGEHPSTQSFNSNRRQTSEIDGSEEGSKESKILQLEQVMDMGRKTLLDWIGEETFADVYSVCSELVDSIDEANNSGNSGADSHKVSDQLRRLQHILAESGATVPAMEVVFKMRLYITVQRGYNDLLNR